MKRYYLVLSIILIFFGLSISYMNAQQNHPQMRGKIRENIFTLRALRMTQELELTEQQTALIFPELNRAEKEKAELQRNLAKEIKELRGMIKEEKTPPDQYEAKIAQINQLRIKIREREEVFEKFLFEQLTPLQKAKYIIFNVDFNANLMMRMRREAQPGQKIK